METSMRLIDANVAGDAIAEAADKYDGYDSCQNKIIQGLMEAQDIVAAVPTVDAVEVVHDKLFNLPHVTDKDYQFFVDGLEDYFKEAAFEDRSVGIFGLTEGETLLANALMGFLKVRCKEGR